LAQQILLVFKPSVHERFNLRANSFAWWYPVHGVSVLSLACQPGHAAH